MDILVICLVLVVAGGFAFQAFRKGVDDADWEGKWESLDDLDRAWIAAASLSRVDRPALEERGELELAKGYSRRQVRRYSRIALAMLPLFIVPVILILVGVLAGSWILTILYASLLLVNLGRGGRYRDKKKYKRVQEEYLVAEEGDATPA